WNDSAAFQPYVTPDGNALYFTSWHPFDLDAHATHNLWRVDLSQGHIGAPAVVDVSTWDLAAFENAAVGSPDEPAIYYASTKGGPFHMWLATRSSTSDHFGNPRLLDELTATNVPNGSDWPNYITPDACELYFTSERSGVSDFYVAKRPPRR